MCTREDILARYLGLDDVISRNELTKTVSFNFQLKLTNPHPVSISRTAQLPWILFVGLTTSPTSTSAFSSQRNALKFGRKKLPEKTADIYANPVIRVVGFFGHGV